MVASPSVSFAPYRAAAEVADPGTWRRRSAVCQVCTKPTFRNKHLSASKLQYNMSLWYHILTSVLILSYAVHLAATHTAARVTNGSAN
jgi:hypothetical protein